MVFIVAKWNVIILIKKNMYMKKEKGAEILMKKRRNISISVLLIFGMFVCMLTGCSGKSGKEEKVTEIEILQYKQEAAAYFEKVEEKFNATHKNIRLKIESPNDASTIMRTRFIREDYPDIIGIGGDINYSYFLDAEILMNISDYKGLDEIKESYKEIDKNLEFVPTDGVYAVPYAGNAAGILYNKKIFEEHGRKIPQTWSELMNLCDEIQAAGLQPFTMGFKDTWTCLAPWNGLAVDLAPSDVCRQVNQGKTTFTENYREVAEKMLQLLSYGPKDPFAYNYNDACTAFARGEAVMYPIGSYAVPQIQSVNPDMEIDSFVFPGSDKKEENTLNSGIDLQFCVTKECKNKEAAYEVLDFLLEDENVQDYLNEQNSVPCKEGEFELSPMLDGVRQYIEEENMADYQDHYYPSEMAVDAQIQTLLIDKDVDAFLKKFDKDWQRYNRDIIQKVQKYEAEQTHSK